MPDPKPKRCQRCGAEEGGDLRTIRISCLYDMSELRVPFSKDAEAFSIVVCKGCRSDFLHAVENWFVDYLPRQSCHSGIFIRDFGASVEITEEEWRRRFADKQPFRVKE